MYIKCDYAEQQCLSRALWRQTGTYSPYVIHQFVGRPINVYFFSRITPLFHHVTTSVISIHCFAVPVVLSAVIYSCLLLVSPPAQPGCTWCVFYCIFCRYCAVLEFDVVPYLGNKSWSEADTGLSVSQILGLVSLTVLGNKKTWQCYSNYISIWYFYIRATV